MKQPTAPLRPVTLVLNNIELILTLIGLLAILVMPRLLGKRDTLYVMAVTATFVGTLQGILLWTVHQRQRAIRRETIAAVRLMMQDMVKNQLSVIMTSTHLASKAPEKGEYAERVNRSVQDISLALDTLSEESLTRWENRYRNH